MPEEQFLVRNDLLLGPVLDQLPPVLGERAERVVVHLAPGQDGHRVVEELDELFFDEIEEGEPSTEEALRRLVFGEAEDAEPGNAQYGYALELICRVLGEERHPRTLSQLDLSWLSRQPGLDELGTALAEIGQGAYWSFDVVLAPQEIPIGPPTEYHSSYLALMQTNRVIFPIAKIVVYMNLFFGGATGFFWTESTGMVNIEDVMNTEVGAIIRQRSAGQVQPLTMPFVGQQACPVPQYMDEIKEARTGIPRAGCFLYQ